MRKFANMAIDEDAIFAQSRISVTSAEDADTGADNDTAVHVPVASNQDSSPDPSLTPTGSGRELLPRATLPDSNITVSSSYAMENPNDLAGIRARLGITQSVMAKQLGLSLRAYQGLEAGERPPKQMHILAAKSLLGKNSDADNIRSNTSAKSSTGFFDLLKNFFSGNPTSYEKAAIGRLPSSLWDHVRKYIINDPIYRESSTISFSLGIAEKYETGEKSIYIHYHIQQVVRNISDQKYIYPIRLDLERGKTDGQDERNVFSNFRLSINNRLVNTKIAKAQPAVSPENGAFYRYNHNIVMEPNEFVSIEMHVRDIKQSISGFEVWRTKHCCKSLNFNINFPPEIELFVDSLHPAPVELVHSSKTMISGRISEPLLPHNGIMFWWKPR